MKIFLYDVRDPPSDDWIVLRSFTEFRDFIESVVMYGEAITEISLDHDLGDDAGGTGYDAVCLIEQLCYEGKLTRDMEIKCHSSNPPGRQRIESAISSIKS